MEAAVEAFHRRLMTHGTLCRFYMAGPKGTSIRLETFLFQIVHWETCVDAWSDISNLTAGLWRATYSQNWGVGVDSGTGLKRHMVMNTRLDLWKMDQQGVKVDWDCEKNIHLAKNCWQISIISLDQLTSSCWAGLRERMIWMLKFIRSRLTVSLINDRASDTSAEPRLPEMMTFSTETCHSTPSSHFRSCQAPGEFCDVPDTVMCF